MVTLAFSLEYRKKYITLCHDKITNMNFAFLVEFLLLVARATVHTTVQNTCLLYSFILIHIYLSWVFFYIQFCSIADSKQISQSQSETKTEYTHKKCASSKGTKIIKKYYSDIRWNCRNKKNKQTEKVEEMDLFWEDGTNIARHQQQ